MRVLQPQVKIYTRVDIKKVYHQHVYHCGSVVYSDDKGYTWHSVPMDTGKWNHEWVYAFIEIK